MTPIVLVHGWGMNARVFNELSDDLSARAEVCALPLPGYDGLPTCGADLDAIALALSRRAPRPCVVAGWSLGGLAALEWARAAPEQVERLVLLGATPSFVRRDDWADAIEAPVLQEFARALERDPPGTLRRFLTLQVEGEAAPAETLRKLRACSKEGEFPARATLREGLELLLKSDIRNRLPAVRQKTLVVHGARDALVPLAAAEFLAGTLPRAQLAVIGGAGHPFFVSNAQTTARLIFEFCGE